MIKRTILQEQGASGMKGSGAEKMSREEIIRYNKDFLMNLTTSPMKEIDVTQQRLRRAFGSIVGAYIGDAIGAYLEFKKKDHISDEMLDNAFNFKGIAVMGSVSGQITDDSEMAMCILHGLTPGESETVRLAGNDKVGSYSLNLDKI